MTYKVTINGKSYEVAVERTDAPEKKAPDMPVKESQPVTAAAGEEKVIAPMPGTILNINVAAGDAVKAGQTLVILEAMKMENEIVSPRDGVVASIAVSKGASVNANDLLLALK